MRPSVVLHDITAEDVASRSLVRHNDGIVSLSFRDGTQLHWPSYSAFLEFAEHLANMPLRQIGAAA